MVDKRQFRPRSFKVHPDQSYQAIFPQVEPTNTTDPMRPRTEAAGYDPDSNILRVRFRSGAAKGGGTATYEYYGVAPSVWAAFKVTSSPGKFINRILNSYEYERVS